MSDTEQATPRSYDMQAARKHIMEQVVKLVNDVDLRKWCVSEACRFGTVDAHKSGMALAESIYAFVTANMKGGDA